MKVKGILMLCAGAALSMSSVHAASVTYDYDTTADVSAWKSWAWRRPAPPHVATPAEGRIRRSLEAGFAARGYIRVERGEADFAVDYHAAVGRDLRLDEGRGFPGRRDVRVASFAKGVLVVDVFDLRTGRLVWRGSVSDALASDPAKADKKVDKAVEKLLLKFPPAAGT
jgi:hypothetical protein